MKKFTLMLLSLTLAGTLCACGAEKAPADDKAVTQEAAVSHENEPAADKAAASDKSAGDKKAGSWKPGASKENAPAPQNESLSLTEGFWVVDSIEAEGVTLTPENMVEYLETTAADIMTISFRDSGTAYLRLYGNSGLTLWMEDDESITLSVAGEYMSFSKAAPGMLVYEETDGSRMVLKHQKAEPDELGQDAFLSFDPVFSKADACAMSTFMNYGVYDIEDNVLYGPHRVTGGWKLSYRRFDPNEGNSFVKFSDEIVDLDDNYPNFVNKVGDYLYYIRRDDDAERLCRVNLAGGAPEVLYDKNSSFLSVIDDRLYFTDENNYFVSTDLDGNNMTTLVDKPVFYVYPISDGWFIYQDDENNEGLAIFSVLQGQDITLTTCRSYSPIILGTDLYYFTLPDGAEGPRTMRKLNLITREEEAGELPVGCGIGIDGDKIYTTNNNSVDLADWKSLTCNEAEVGMTDVDMYLSPDYRIDHDWEGDRITGRYMFKNATGGGEPIA
ncbi:MAG: DUF5050 domain-containing protein [Lachnospiraceae bacterium]|nr:DUF5050 domain-containing protein [Lachnospiraceae bacterium]